MKQWLLWHLSKVWNAVRFHLASTTITDFFKKGIWIWHQMEYLLYLLLFYSSSPYLYLCKIKMKTWAECGLAMALFHCNLGAFVFLTLPHPSPPLFCPHAHISPCQTLSPHCLRRAVATHFPSIRDVHIFHLSSGFPEAWATLISLRLQTDKLI